MTNAPAPDPVLLVTRLFEVMADGTREELEQLVHRDAGNREALAEPPAARKPGPAGWWATTEWLRNAFSDLRWEVHEAIAAGDLVAVHATMSGRHTGVHRRYAPDGSVAQIFEPGGRRFATTQSHWFRVADGKLVEHWANRDDLGTAMQLGWLPAGR